MWYSGGPGKSEQRALKIKIIGMGQEERFSVVMGTGTKVLFSPRKPRDNKVRVNCTS